MRPRNEKIKRWGRPLGYAFFMSMLIVFFQNCGSEHQGGAPVDQQSVGTGLDPAAFQALENEVAGIFASRCLSCHSSAATSPQLPYLDDMITLHTATPYVVKGSPQTSTMYLRIIDGVMPANGPNLVNTAPVEVMKIRDWIQFIP